MTMMSEIAIILGLCLISYLFGSVPFGKIIGGLKLGNLKRIDVQKAGSGNIGAANLFRTAGVLKGLITAALDVWKGAIPVFLAIYILPKFQHFLPSYWLIVLAIVFTMLGSIFPVWLKFKGGKGVSVLIGGLLMILGWKIWLIVMGCWLIILIFVTKKIVSAASLILVGSLPALAFLWPFPVLIFLSLPVTILVLWGHRENLERLVKGEEKPLDFKFPTVVIPSIKLSEIFSKFFKHKP
jgi:glycerol-3-phosphate acyltransferase PlsY